MKSAEISPVFKKLNNTSKYNYRLISTLSNFTKNFENILFMQLNRYMQNKFSKYLTGFRKNHNTQNSVLRMIAILESQTKQEYIDWTSEL